MVTPRTVKQKTHQPEIPPERYEDMWRCRGRLAAWGRREAAAKFAAIARRCSSRRAWERLQKGVPAEEFTFPGDPMRLDFGYRRNGTRGFVQALSVSRAPADAKLPAYTAAHVREKTKSSEFTAVTDVHLVAENERHRFVQETLREAGVRACLWRDLRCGRPGCGR
jgi:hypothetical protein